jgi:hypothetical protein
MTFPVRGVIERRILVNYRVDPALLRPVLPAPFRPRLVNGWGMAGICLIRLGQMRPAGVPGSCGLRSENAAHRIAVEWDGGEGVFVLRRDTTSWLNVAAGGRLFPGLHRHARFDVHEGGGRYHVSLRSDDGQTSVDVEARVAPALARGSVFGSLDEASPFFARGSLGYSPGLRKGETDALELRCARWEVDPLQIERARSSFFDDVSRFPAGSAQLDCALLMRDVPHEWHRPFAGPAPVSIAMR